MRRFGVVTIFPEMLDPLIDFGVSGRALREGMARLDTWNPRDFAPDRHRTVDERPYGGGPGMVMAAPPLCAAIRAARTALGAGTRVVYLSPQGRRLSQERVEALAAAPEPLVLVVTPSVTTAPIVALSRAVTAMPPPALMVAAASGVAVKSIDASAWLFAKFTAITPPIARLCRPLR